jgi:hypothetical protein
MIPTENCQGEGRAVRFDQYDYFGYILPGAAVVFAAMLFSADVRGQFGNEGIDFAGLGLFIIVSFVVGHVVQAIGYALEEFGHRQIGDPSVLGGEQSLLSAKQKSRLAQRLKTDFDEELENLDRFAWRALRREMYARLAAPSLRERLDTFRGHAGLLRGMTAAMIVIAIGFVIFQYRAKGTAAFVDISAWGLFLVLVLTAGAAGFRARHFRGIFTRELIVQYLSSPKETPPNLGDAGGERLTAADQQPSAA